MMVGSQARRTGGVPVALIVTLVPAAAAVGLAANYAAGLLKLPIYLDTIGTCVVAILLGPWWGALVGVITNLVGSIQYGPTNIPFAVVNIVAALMWGYGVRSLRVARREPGFFLLNAAVGLATGAVAAPIVIFVSGGATGHPSDIITAAFAGAGLAWAVFSSSVLTSLADKIISGYIALAIIQALPASLSDGIALPEQAGIRRVVVAAVGVVIGVAITLVYVLLTPPAA
jgi:energy-coupling factor transport system substrate-specific component